MITMQRPSKLTKAQEDMLLKCLEERLWLVLESNRTAASRARARASWQEIAKLLNKHRNGAFKTWMQWLKYWKDKKTYLKKKLQDLEKNQLSAADSGDELSYFEKGMLNILMRGERSAVSNTAPALSSQAGMSPNRDGSQPDNAEDEEPLSQLQNDEDQQDTEEQRPDLAYRTCDMELSLQQHVLSREDWFREPLVTVEVERPNNTTMNGSRRKTPTTEQQMELLKCLEEKFWLGVNKNNRSGAARQRSRAAWEEIARKLNSYRNGVIRNGIEWAKYWKDKKAAVKRKSQQIENNHLSEDQTYLTDIEQRILEIITREERSRVSDRKPLPSQLHGVSSNRVGIQLPADDHHRMLNIKMEVERSEVSNMKPEPSPQYIVSSDRVGSHLPADDHQRTLNILMEVECSQVSDTESAPSPQAGVAPNRVGSHLPADNADHDAAQNSTDEARPTPRGSRDWQSSATPLRRRRRVVARKRRSLVAALVERFLAVEERRVDNETQMTHVLRTMSDAWLQQTRAIQDLANTLRTHY